MANPTTEKKYIFKMIEKMVNNSLAVVVKFSGIKECSMTTKICRPTISLFDGVVVIWSQNYDNDENEIQIDISNFEFNEYNSNESKLVFNSELNFANSLSIHKSGM